MVSLARSVGSTREHFFFSYLTAYSACLTLVLGMMFFVLLHYVADAGWSTVVRRPAEQCLATLPALAVLLLPVLAGMSWLYPWIGADGRTGSGQGPVSERALLPGTGRRLLRRVVADRTIFRHGSLTQDEPAIRKSRCGCAGSAHRA